jgi:hypothetical protein
MGVGRLSTEVKMAVDAIGREMDGAYLRLAEAAAAMRYRQRHYLDGRGAGRLFGPATALTAAHPWALAGFGASAWADYRPDPQAPPPDGLRVGVLRLGEGVPPVPAVARFAGHGHLLISERGFADGARSLLQALTLRLATATRPGTVRFALADPVGQGRYLSAFLRLPAQLRVGTAGGLRVGVAASPAETETAEADRRDGREVVPVRRGQRGPERAGIESVFPRGGQQPLEGQRPERQDAGQHLAERLHPLLDLGGLLLRRPLPLRQVLLLAEPFGVFLALPVLARQPVFVASLRGEALLPRREAPDPGHGSPGLRTDSYEMTITCGRTPEKVAAGLALTLLPHPARGLLGLAGDVRGGRLGLAGHGGSRVRGRLPDRSDSFLRGLPEFLGRLLAGLAELFGHRAALLRGEILDLGRDLLFGFGSRQQ